MPADPEPPDPPPSLIVLPLLTLAWFLLAVPNVTDAGIGFNALCLLAPLSALVLIFWFWALLAVTTAPPPRNPRWFRTWAGCTAAVVFALVLAHPAVGFRARVWLSSAALERFARSLPPDAYSSEPAGMVGLFYVTNYNTGPDGAAAIYTSETGLVNRAGILYQPPGSTVPKGVQWHEHVFGPWHWCYWDF